MTAAEIHTERNHRVTERIGIMRDDGLDPTPQQRRIAHEEADTWEEMITAELRREKLEQIAKLAASNRRNYHLEKRFSK